MKPAKATVEYDVENDQLAIEKEGVSVASTIEMGDIIFDFDKDGIICGLEFLDAASLLKDMVVDAKELDLSQVTDASLSQHQSGNNIIIRFSLVSKTHTLETSLPLPIIEASQ